MQVEGQSEKLGGVAHLRRKCKPLRILVTRKGKLFLFAEETSYLGVPQGWREIWVEGIRIRGRACACEILSYNPSSMIAHLRGRLLAKSPNQAVVECGGVGYDLAISVETFGSLPELGGEAKLFVHTHVREDQLALFGFADTREKRLFEKLLTISGIGPKLAITVLSGIATERLIGAIRGQDHGTLTKIPGIGKKTAERIVLELKDKLDELSAATTDAGGRPAVVGSLGSIGDDAVSALVNLGYPRPSAQRAVEAAIEKEPESGREFEVLFRAAMNAIR